MFGRAAIKDHHMMLWPDLNSFILQLILFQTSRTVLIHYFE